MYYFYVKKVNLYQHHANLKTKATFPSVTQDKLPNKQSIWSLFHFFVFCHSPAKMVNMSSATLAKDVQK